MRGICELRRVSISTKLLTIYLIIAIPLIAIIALAYLDRYRNQTEIILRERTDTALLAAHSFTLFVKDICWTMQGHGMAIVENQYPPDRAASTLGRLLDVYPISHAVMTDADGKVVAATDTSLLGQDFSNHEALRAVITGTRQLGIEPLEHNQKPTGFHIACAIRDEAGEVQRAIVCYIDIAKLQRQLEIDIDMGGINIVDSNGYLVFQSEYPRLPLTHPFWGRYDFVKDALAGRRATGTFTFPATGRSHIVVEVPIEEFGWAAGSNVDREQTLAPIRQSFINSALLTIAILFVTFAVSVFITRRITRSLNGLTAAAHAIGEGRFNEPVSVKTADEIEDVANSLDVARIDLKQAQERLKETARISDALYEAQRNIAETLQTSLLAIAERIEGVEFGHLYRSATEAAQVGGDFYDIFEIEHGKIGVIVGDVSGKGIEAASLTTVVKNTIKAHAYEEGTPAVIMAKTNDLVRRVAPAGNFITVFFGMLDTETGRLSYCSAGHPPAIIKREKGGVDLLDKHSPVIGAFSGFHYRTAKERLGKGDTLIAYTDGIIEARCDGGFYGQERLVEFVKNLESIPAKEIPEAILNDVIRCIDGRLSDDAAILAVSL